MSLTIRRAETADAAKCGAILYAAFQKVADQPEALNRVGVDCADNIICQRHHI
jgi:hypothetical protein